MYQFRGRISRRSAGEHKTRREGKTGVSDLTSLLVHRVCRYHWLVSIPAVVMLLILSFGISFLKGSVNLQNRFAERTKIIQDYQWLEANLGPLVPLEVVVGFDDATEIPSWQQMLLVERIERDLLQNGIATASMSAATFKPKISRSRSLTSRLKSQVTIDRWENDLQQLIDANLVQAEGHQHFWRISLRVPALNRMDYGKLLDSVETRVTDGGVSARFTGGIPLFYHAQHQILNDLRNSFVTAFLLISAVLVIVLHSFRAGLVAMIPNVFPPLFVFGAMGWMGLPVEIGSVMTASVALGIAVDDTIHFLTWYRRGVLQDRSRLSAIRFAFEHCAKPMIDTTLICGLGVAAFMFADFMPTVRFSRLLFILLFAALIGDLFLLPAILAGPAGKLFRNKVPKSGEDSPSHEVRPVTKRAVA
jgi:predicted RND superfamily exporter protein